MTTLQYIGGTIVYIQESSGQIQYSLDDSTWNPLTFPVSVQNTNNAGGNLKVFFSTDITLTSSSQFFVCNSSYIQFGNTQLKQDGSRPIITVTASSYDGLIENGLENSPGNSNIYVYNLVIDGSSGTLQIGAGWFGKKFYGNGVGNLYFTNCSSLGPIADQAGGIVASYAAQNSGNITITGCSSTGTIGEGAGGIVGYQACYLSGTVTCSQCYSTGSISQYGGGIFGSYAGVSSGNATASKCYSTGIIGEYAGGIFGAYAASNAGSANASNCYSNGSIDARGGGIMGYYASNDGGSAQATNCYSIGIVVTPGTEIFGTHVEPVVETRCYGANGSWNSSTAASNLTGVPVGPSKVGSSWVETVTSNPYEINEIGFTPYVLTMINGSSALIQTSSFTVEAGNGTDAAIKVGSNYSILAKSGGDSGSYSTITINNSTGLISTTTETVAGTYTIVIRNTGSYNITTVTLTVTEIPVPPTPPTPLTTRPVNWALVGPLIGVCVVFLLMHPYRKSLLK